MSFHLSTKERLLLLIDDIEMISKELIEQAHQKISSTELVDLLDLLVSKDEEFRKMLELAEEQAKVEEAMDKLRAKVEIHVSIYLYVYIVGCLLFTNSLRTGKYKSCRNHSKMRSLYCLQQYFRHARNWQALIRPINVQFLQRNSSNMHIALVRRML